jgi:hypothetical protein
VSEDDPDEATIERRSKNADLAMLGLVDAIGCAWMAWSLVLVAVPTAVILLK